MRAKRATAGGLALVAEMRIELMFPNSNVFSKQGDLGLFLN